MKPFAATLILGTLGLLPSPVHAQLVAHWKLDDASGTTAVDSAGANNNGILINSPSWVIGTVGGGLDFNGINQRVSAPLTGISERCLGKHNCHGDGPASVHRPDGNRAGLLPGPRWSGRRLFRRRAG